MSHPCILVMGVSGSGKTTIGQELADRIGAVFLEGDDYHPQRNKEHMAAGHPLNDAMRRPWLAALAAAVAEARRTDKVVFACSALKRSYRDMLREALPGLRLVYPQASFDVIRPRMVQRQDHFMPPALLQSQFDTLEPPDPSEHPITVSAALPVARIVADIRAALDRP